MITDWKIYDYYVLTAILKWKPLRVETIVDFAQGVQEEFLRGTSLGFVGGVFQEGQQPSVHPNVPLKKNWWNCEKNTRENLLEGYSGSLGTLLKSGKRNLG